MMAQEKIKPPTKLLWRKILIVWEMNEKEERWWGN